jgi:hypothetical protein
VCTHSVLTSHTNAILLLLLLLPSAAGISNGLLQEWPKVHKCRTALANVLELTHPEPPAASAPTAAADGGSSNPEPVGNSSAPAAAAAAAAESAVLACDNGAGTDPAIAAAEAADGDLPWPVLFHHVMGDVQLVPPEQEVPLTGVGEQLDRRLSSVFIEPFEMQVSVAAGGGKWVESDERCALLAVCPRTEPSLRTTFIDKQSEYEISQIMLWPNCLLSR